MATVIELFEEPARLNCANDWKDKSSRDLVIMQKIAFTTLWRCDFSFDYVTIIDCFSRRDPFLIAR